MGMAGPQPYYRWQVPLIRPPHAEMQPSPGPANHRRISNSAGFKLLSIALFRDRIAISCWAVCCLWIASAAAQPPQFSTPAPVQTQSVPARLPEGDSSVPAPPLNLTDLSRFQGLP